MNERANERRVYLYSNCTRVFLSSSHAREQAKILAPVRVFSYVVAFINLVAINQQRYVTLEVIVSRVYARECRVCFTKEHFALNNIPNC